MSARWLDDNGMTVRVDAPRPREHQLFEGGRGLAPDARIQLVHVLSRHAGGEIRGYVIVEGENLLRLRLPAYTGDWPEMDAAVGERLGMDRWSDQGPAQVLPGQLGLFEGPRF